MEDIVPLWNSYVESANLPYKIYAIDQLDDYFKGSTPTEVAQALCVAGFNITRDYFAVNNKNKIESFDDIDDFSAFEVVDLAEYIIANNIDYKSLEKFDTEEDEENFNWDEIEDEDERNERLMQYVSEHEDKIITILKQMDVERLATLWNETACYLHGDDYEYMQMIIYTQDDLKRMECYTLGSSKILVSALHNGVTHRAKFFEIDEEGYISSFYLPWEHNYFNWDELFEYIFTSGEEEELSKSILKQIKK